MIRRNNDSFFGPPMGSKQYAPERPGTRSVYIHNTGHPAFNPAPFNSQEQGSSEKAVLYDPYDPGSSGSDTEGHEDLRSVLQRTRRVGYEGPAHHGDFPWDSTYSKTGSRPDQLSRGHGPPPDQMSRGQGPPPDQLSRGHGPPPRPMATPGAPMFPLNAYGGRGANGVEASSVAASDKDERATGALRITPPRLKMDYQHQSGFGGSEMDQIRTTPEVSRKRSRSPSEEIRGSFSCDLCEVELSEAKALEEHIECRSHWETLEHIQLQNKYDDMAIAFIQESLLHKVRKGDQVMDDDASDALRENDHMTKVEMLHCAPCKVYIPTSVSSVQNHLNSQEHLRNKQEFRLKQRDACLTTAEALMKRLTPQYALFLEGKDPFE